VVQRLFPNILPYVGGTPAVFGCAEWNGRSLTDNAPDVMFSIAANAPFRPRPITLSSTNRAMRKRNAISYRMPTGGSSAGT